MGNVEIDLSGVEIDVDSINPNAPVLTDEQLASVEDIDDPILQAVSNELDEMAIEGGEAESPIATYAEGDDAETGGETKTPLTAEQKEIVLAMFQQYLDFWYENEDVLGVQLPFYLNSNDNGEDDLGILGQMLVLAGVSVDDVRNGNYGYNDLTGMIMNFQYGDSLGVKYYGADVEAARDAALKAVAASGAETEAQKLLVLNTWLAQHNTFDMSYIMNQMDPSNPVMAAEDAQPHEHYQDVYNVLNAVYTEQLTAQFRTQFTTSLVYMGTVKNIQKAIYLEQEMSSEEAETAAQDFVNSNSVAINGNPEGFIRQTYPKQAEEIIAKAKEQIANPSDDVIAVVDQMMATQEVPELGNMTANEAIPIYADQAAAGLTTGVLGYWQGNHIGALAEGASVCMGYAKALAYLVQCMHPEIYLKDGATDVGNPENWNLPTDVYEFDEATGSVKAGEGAYNVDMVRITFQAAVSMYGVPQPDFSSDHFWNAVKLENGQWYYIDPCYTDVWSEVMIRDRVETDGAMNHTYFLISDDSLRNMFSGNYDEDTGIVTLYDNLANHKDYEDSWISRINSNVYSDGNYFYYLYNSTDLISMMEAYQESDNNNYGELMEMNNADIKIVRHKITSADAGTDGDTNYETLIDFTHKDTEDAEESYVAVRNASGQLMRNEMLTELYAQFKAEQEVYPSISITPVYSNGKVYFNLSNCILSYDLSSCEVVKVKEYNTVYAQRDDTVAFGAMAFDMIDSAEDADFTFENHPIAGIALKDDGQLYVDIATNLSYISGRPDQHDYASTTDEEGNRYYGYEYEETNYNSDYNSYANAEAEDSGMNDDFLEQIGYKAQTNDNDEFMWVANVVDTLDMAHFAGDSHNYVYTRVAATCGRDAYTENRCAECGAIEPGTRTVAEGSALNHHFVSFNEEYNTSDSEIAPNGKEPTGDQVSAEDAVWNEGSSYVCVVCGAAVSQDEPEEPDETDMIYSQGYMDFDSAYAKYEHDHALWELASANHDVHNYVPTDAVWTDDGDGTGTVTFQMLECSVCGDRKLDCLQDNADIQVTLSQQHTLDCTVEVIESTCEGTAKVYTLKEQTITDGDKTYTVSAANVQQVTPGPGHQADAFQYDENHHWKVCTVCGKSFAEGSHTGNPCTVCGYAATTGGDGGNQGNQGGQTGGGSQPVDEHPDIAEGIANGTWGGTATTSASGSAEAPAAQQTAAIPETADEMPLQAVTIAAVLSGIAAAALVLLRKRNTDR